MTAGPDIEHIANPIKSSNWVDFQGKRISYRFYKQDLLSELITKFLKFVQFLQARFALLQFYSFYKLDLLFYSFYTLDLLFYIFFFSFYKQDLPSELITNLAFLKVI